MIDLELREKVARLLGWNYDPERGELTQNGVMRHFNIPGKSMAWLIERGMIAVPPYEATIAAAWEAVGFMRDKKKRRLHLYQRDQGDWFAEFVPIEIGQAYQPGCTAPTAPLAICKAFLAAMENKYES